MVSPVTSKARMIQRGSPSHYHHHQNKRQHQQSPQQQTPKGAVAGRNNNNKRSQQKQQQQQQSSPMSRRSESSVCNNNSPPSKRVASFATPTRGAAQTRMKSGGGTPKTRYETPSPTTSSSSSPSRSSPGGCFASSKCFEPPTPDSLPKPPTDWMNECGCRASSNGGDLDVVTTRQLRILLNC